MIIDLLPGHIKQLSDKLLDKVYRQIDIRLSKGWE